MKKAKNNNVNGLFWILLILGIVVGFLFYGVFQDQFSLKFLILFSGVPFLLFVTGSFGLLWPRIKPVGDEIYIEHALFIGLLFIVLFFLHVWLVLPQICPEFGACLGI
jgi:hypothetical protein